MVVSKAGEGVNICTGFLLYEDVIVTNSHCIPENINKTNTQIDKDVGIIFPKTKDKKEEKIYGTKILLSYKLTDSPSNSKDDLAVIKLEQKTNRKLFEVDGSGFENNEIIELYNVDYKKGNKFAKIEYKKCKVLYNTIVSPLAFNKYSPHIALGDCDVKDGNSGSPIIAKDGKVKAILFSKLEYNKTLKIFKNNLKVTPSKMGIAINFSCLIPDKIKGNDYFPNECFIESEKKQTYLLSRNIFLILNKIEKTLNKIKKNVKLIKFYDFLKWDIGFYAEVKSNSSLNISKLLFYSTAEPKCIINLSDFLFGFMRNKEKKFYYKAMYLNNMPVFSINYSLNKYFQISNAVVKKIYDNVNIIVIIDEAEYNKTEYGVTKLEIGIALFNENKKQLTTTQSFTIPICE